MSKFYTSNGLRWNVVVDDESLAYLRNRLQIDLRMPPDYGLTRFNGLRKTDPNAPAAIIWGFVRGQAAKREISRDQFNQMLGDSVGPALEAIGAAVSDFAETIK